PNYANAPVVNLGDDSLVMTMQIVPLKAPSGSNPLATSLTLTLVIYNGALEIQPTLLAPLNAGVTARQVKLGQALLAQTLAEMAAQAAGTSGALTYTAASIQPDAIQLTFVKAG